MIIDLKSIYLTLIVLLIMIVFTAITLKKIISIKSKFTTVLLFIEEIIGACTFGYLLSLAYKAMEDYEVFVQKYGNMSDRFTYISIYFCASQIILYLLVTIYSIIKKNSRMIKKRRIMK